MTQSEQPGTKASESLPSSLLELVTDFPDWEKGPEVKVECPECGTSHQHNKYLAAVYKETVCDDCASVYAVDRAKEVEFKIPNKAEEHIPKLYLDTDPNRLPYAQRYAVENWSKAKGRGLWLVGDTRTGKTRTLCLLLKKLIDEGESVRVFFHGAFGDDLMEVMRSERSYKKWKREIATAPILAIDDLFANKLTERAESSLFEILDERIAYDRPTFVTTQVAKQDAAKVFHSKTRHLAFFARIKEFFDVHKFNQKQDVLQKI